MSDQACELPASHSSDRTIQEVLVRYKTIAVVGLSRSAEKPSHAVPKYLKDHGYRVIPVNPTAQGSLLGEPVYKTLDQIPQQVEVVNIFRPAAEVPDIVNQAISIGAKVVWMQEGIVHNEAARQAMEAGLTVVMNRCMMKEHRRLRGSGS